MKCILIAAGGTGGHIFPALALADALMSRGFKVVWLGSRHGLEQQILAKQKPDIDLHLIDIKGIRKKGLKAWLYLPGKLAKALWQTRKIFAHVKPDIVLAMGGFVSGPCGIVAKLLRIPLVLHEQNAIAGMTNRWLLLVANKAFMGFPNSFANKCRAKLEYVGQPLNQAIKQLPKPFERWQKRDPKRQFNLLVLGGSQGAVKLNTIVPQALSLLRPLSVNVYHQCGHRHLTATKLAYKEQHIEACILPFIDDMASAYAKADFVICRAGAMTVAELSAVGVGAILIPYRFAVDDHQSYNGQFLVKAGGAVIIQEPQLTETYLADMIKVYCHHERSLARAIATRSQGQFFATERIIEYLSFLR